MSDDGPLIDPACMGYLRSWVRMFGAGRVLLALEICARAEGALARNEHYGTIRNPSRALVVKEGEST